MTTKNKLFTLPEKDKWNTAGAALYDPGFAAYLGLIFDPKRDVVDVGANVGKITRFLALRTTRSIIAYEPGPKTRAALKINTAHLPNVIIRDTAVGAKSGTALFIGDGTVTAHLSNTGRGTTISVDIVTLDDDLPSDLDVGLIKIDVEGGEAGVIKGALRIIRKYRPLLAVEMIADHLKNGGTTREEIFAYLAEVGYLRAVNKYGLTETAAKTTGAADVFFIPDKNWYAPRLYIGYERYARKIIPHQKEAEME